MQAYLLDGLRERRVAVAGPRNVLCAAAVGHRQHHLCIGSGEPQVKAQDVHHKRCAISSSKCLGEEVPGEWCALDTAHPAGAACSWAFRTCPKLPVRTWNELAGAGAHDVGAKDLQFDSTTTVSWPLEALAESERNASKEPKTLDDAERLPGMHSCGRLQYAHAPCRSWRQR